MKRTAIFILALILALSTAVCAAAGAEADTPKIALTYVPLYGGDEPFEGVVFTEDGSAFRTEDYRVTMYLYAGGDYYVKPSEANPTVELKDDGSFSIPYTIAPQDRNAVLFQIILLPAGYTELPWVLHSQSALDEILENALDCVTVERREDGGIAISPERTVPAAAFSDVPSNAYYAEAVRWAVENGVTNGMGDGTFGSARTVTRAQAVTFLWRASGQPRPGSDAAAFSDLTQDWYRDAVQWAVENGITSGTAADRFSPEQTCTHDHILTFLYRLAGEPGKTGQGAWYSDAVSWARGLSILDGTTEYATGVDCPRRDVAYYLWKFFAQPAGGSEAQRDMAKYSKAKTAAVTALTDMMREERQTLYVYRDFGMTENHFTQKAKMAGYDASLVKDMDENWRTNPYAGRSCIRCTQTTARNDWGGWLFLNGYLPDGEVVPRLNDGGTDGQGLNLTGAEELRFFARGETGGETVEFFTLGFGYNGETGRRTADYPDSAAKQSLGFITLNKEWTEYVIPLQSADLSYVVCGFGYVLNGEKSGNTENVFYLDEIRFVGNIAGLEQSPMMLRSYETDNIYIQNAAFSYDNALTAMAFLSEGMEKGASEILDAFVYGVEHDREKPGRVRNAYAAGDIAAFPGWGGTARLPGWYDTDSGAWYEDRYQVGSNVGNTSYVVLALLQYDAKYGNERYLSTAKTLMDWVIRNCSDGGDGFTAGFDGWAEGNPPVVYPFTYKSIEHNIDAYAAFSQLFARTGDRTYQEAADSALRFIQSMYDADTGVFYAGTLAGGVTPNTGNIVLDAQVWTAMALGDAFTPYEASLRQVDEMRTSENGYPFSKANAAGGWWAEGTAYTALMYSLRGEADKAEAALDALCRLQLGSGLFPSATVDHHTTGFDLFDGSPWVYSTDPHIAPAAWFVMAVNDFNPYVFAE